MSSSSQQQSGQPDPGKHPLLEDPPRLNTLLRVMHLAIESTIFGSPQPADTERTLVGGESANDVLQEALLALLKTQVLHEGGTWEACGVRIARNKAVDAVRHSTAGRRAGAQPGEPDTIQIIGGTAAGELIADRAHANVWDDPQAAFELFEQQTQILDLARALPEPARTVFTGIFYAGRTRVDVGHQIGRTPQRVGQIFTETLADIYTRLPHADGEHRPPGLAEETP